MHSTSLLSLFSAALFLASCCSGQVLFNPVPKKTSHSFSIRLSRPPRGSVDVYVENKDFAFDKCKVTFGPENYNMEQVVTVREIPKYGSEFPGRSEILAMAVAANGADKAFYTRNWTYPVVLGDQISTGRCDVMSNGAVTTFDGWNLTGLAPGVYTLVMGLKTLIQVNVVAISDTRGMVRDVAVLYDKELRVLSADKPLAGSDRGFWRKNVFDGDKNGTLLNNGTSNSRNLTARDANRTRGNESDKHARRNRSDVSVSEGRTNRSIMDVKPFGRFNTSTYGVKLQLPDGAMISTLNTNQTGTDGLATMTIQISLPAFYSGQTQGICGNFDENTANDNLGPVVKTEYGQTVFPFGVNLTAFTDSPSLWKAWKATDDLHLFNCKDACPGIPKMGANVQNFTTCDIRSLLPSVIPESGKAAGGPKQPTSAPVCTVNDGDYTYYNASFNPLQFRCTVYTGNAGIFDEDGTNVTSSTIRTCADRGPGLYCLNVPNAPGAHVKCTTDPNNTNIFETKCSAGYAVNTGKCYNKPDQENVAILQGMCKDAKVVSPDLTSFEKRPCDYFSNVTIPDGESRFFCIGSKGNHILQCPHNKISLCTTGCVGKFEEDGAPCGKAACAAGSAPVTIDPPVATSNATIANVASASSVTASTATLPSQTASSSVPAATASSNATSVPMATLQTSSVTSSAVASAQATGQATTGSTGMASGNNEKSKEDEEEEEEESDDDESDADDDEDYEEDEDDEVYDEDEFEPEDEDTPAQAAPSLVPSQAVPTSISPSSAPQPTSVLSQAATSTMAVTSTVAATSTMAVPPPASSNTNVPPPASSSPPSIKMLVLDFR